MDQTETLGQRISKKMNEKNVSKKDLCEVIGLSINTLNGYLSDRRNPDYETLKRMAAYLGTSCDYLINYEVKFPDVNTLSPEEFTLVDTYRTTTKDGKEFMLIQAQVAREHYK